MNSSKHVAAKVGPGQTKMAIGHSGSSHVREGATPSPKRAAAPHLSLVHQVEHKAILLPVDAVNLPIQLGLPFGVMLLVHRLLHLFLKVLDNLRYELPPLRRLLVL